MHLKCSWNHFMHRGPGSNKREKMSYTAVVFLSALWLWTPCAQFHQVLTSFDCLSWWTRSSNHETNNPSFSSLFFSDSLSNVWENNSYICQISRLMCSVFCFFFFFQLQNGFWEFFIWFGKDTEGIEVVWGNVHNFSNM